MEDFNLLNQPETFKFLERNKGVISIFSEYYFEMRTPFPLFFLLTYSLNFSLKYLTL